MKKEMYEKLDLFYLGKELSRGTVESEELPFLYKSKNLTTHGVIIGMTGSGKTGLGVGLIEEACMDGIPSIVIDPKGDMANLLLTFPELKPEDFMEWLDASDAQRKGKTLNEFAREKAELWRNGLKKWGQDPSRIREMKEKVEFEIYTPGHTAGTPVSILSKFEAPGSETLADTMTLNSLVNTTVSSLLALVGISGDPLKSREHILLSSILLKQWKNGQDLSMEMLIGKTVSPDIKKIGVFPLDTFFPQKDRMALAMSLNNVLASPGFSAWIQGDPLHIESMLYTREGKPRCCIFSIAHLNDSERMFFVTLLLNRFISWMRRQKGSSTLKTLLYMDEVFGYFPPTANPPSKKPMMLLLKQARAFGVGIVLATQNPVDLDYKGLSNIGSWFIGRLQTPQDQNRVVGGIAASSPSLKESTIRTWLSNMKSRTFLLHSTHLDEPILFGTRWVLSYLKGPVSLEDIKRLNPGKKTEKLEMPPEPVLSPAKRGNHPILSGALPQKYHLPEIPLEEFQFQAFLAARATLRFFDKRRKIDETKQLFYQIPLEESFIQPNWVSPQVSDEVPENLTSSPPENAFFGTIPTSIQTLKSFKEYEKELSDMLYHSQCLTLHAQSELKLESTPGELLSTFHMRIQDTLRETKSTAIEKVQNTYRTKLKRIEKQIHTAVGRLEKEEYDVKNKTMDTALSFGVAVLGALFGKSRRSSISRSATGLKSAGRMFKEKGDVQRAKDKLQSLEEERQHLVSELEEKIDQIHEKFAPEHYPVSDLKIKPRRQDIYDVDMFLLWEAVWSP